MQEVLTRVLKHVGLFIILVRLKLAQKFLTDESSTLALKLSKKRSYRLDIDIVRYRSIFLLNSPR